MATSTVFDKPFSTEEDTKTYEETENHKDYFTGEKIDLTYFIKRGIISSEANTTLPGEENNGE